MAKKFTTLSSKPELKRLREEITAVLKKFEDQNIRLEIGTISYSADGLSADMKIKANVIEVDGKTIDPNEESFKKYSSIFGLEDTDYGKEFKTFRGTYVLTGLVPNRPKFPVLAKSKTDGKIYKFPEEVLKLIKKVA
jgi:hypothetical protein